MTGKAALTNEALDIDPRKEVERITANIQATLSKKLKRRGLIVAMSGGIDSSVTAGLAAKAVGPQRVRGLLMPERHSSDDTLELSQSVAEVFNIKSIHENISGILESLGFYRRYNEAVRSVIPEYGDDWKSKIVIPNLLDYDGFNFFSVVAETPAGNQIKKRLPLKAYLEIVAATNFKQRTRKMLEYYHADRLNFAVTGTPNRLEYDQGFFVKLGDGAADIKPIAHLYKTQVYRLAEYLKVPDNICKRPPTTDTYSLSQGQDEFYFSLDYKRMDLCLYAKNNGYAPDQVSEAIGLSPKQVMRVFQDIETKRRTTRYLHLQPQLITDVSEIDYN